MQSVEETRGKEPSAHSGAHGASAPRAEGAEGAGPEKTQDPPTVVRTPSSLARKLQAGQGSAVQAPAVALLPRAGEIIGTFVLEEAIGVGGMGAVFRALDVQLDRRIALKLLPLDQTDDPEIVQRFYQEGRSSAQLDHENIARVFSIGQDGPYHFIAFEYIEGETVRRRVDEKGPLPAAETVDISLQISQALVHASDRGVVHRDIKPSNIILTPQGRAKLVDMGLARRFERDTDHGLTQSGMTLGTFDYISPEQARDPRDVDVRSDLYSLGCTMFHMLAGRPPFPGGTVLQKLLQHQEEPPPDIRGLNDSVPAELGRLIGKLLAKDRERRYQTPEQVVRDLLVIAGQMGMPVLPSDSHPWSSRGDRKAWERHLVWLLPGLAFCTVIGLLAWWGRELNDPAAASMSLPSPRTAVVEPSGSVRPAAVPANGPSGRGAAAADDPRPLVTSQPRNIAVRPGDDLASILSAAPPRAVITLTEDGPYVIGARGGNHRATAVLTGRDLTIKADSGTRPVLRFAADSAFADGATAGIELGAGTAKSAAEKAVTGVPPALLWFSGGSVSLDGLTFELDSDGPAVQAALVAEDTSLTIRGCMFRQGSRSDGRDRTAIRLRSQRPQADGIDRDRPPRVLVDTCHFDGFQAGIASEGATDLILRDCTLGPCSPAIRVFNRAGDAPVPADIRLRHSSFMAGDGPVLELEGVIARVQCDDSVVAPAGSTPATLVAVDVPRDLTWQGRYNLFYRIRTFLKPTGEADESQAIDDFGSWCEAGSALRETDTILARSPVWNSPRPLQELTIDQENPTEAFTLSSEYGSRRSFGVRQGPYAARTLEPAHAAGPGEPPAAGDPAKLASAAAKSSRSATIPNPAADGRTTAATKDVEPAERRLAAETKGAPSPTIPPSVVFGPTEPAARVETTPKARQEASPAPPARPPASPGPVSPVASAPPVATSTGSNPGESNNRTSTVTSDEDVIRSAAQLLNAVSRDGARGGTLRIARNADLDLSPIDLSSSGRWIIESEEGAGSRPRLRLRPPAFGSRSPSSWMSLFQLRSGSLTLRGLDLVLPRQEIDLAMSGPEAAVAVSPGTRLEILDTTITIADRSPRSAAIAVQPTMAPWSPREASSVSTILVSDSLLRSCGDAIVVASGRPVDIQLRSVLVGTEGSLLHATGMPQAPSAGPPATASSPTLKVRIDRSTARTKGGLVYLESTPDLKEPATTAIEASNSILTTAGQEPLFRVDGQGSLDQLRDRIAWKADHIAYVQISTYRRDQVRQTGVSPRDYSRSDWKTAFDASDSLPIIEGVRFRNRLDPDQPACSLSKDDFSLDPQGLALDRGPDLGQLPSPPATDS
ncbi:serine/threonine-protein kinase [Aquisphaera insulae]|uniref:serine/threonine-protein kinase n=1 Tax=Aquisphaera insulae TaxID=2712864 RepID=UPI0013EA15EB|nr:serine/threonine-protein kinase [Aquisphaera insulae]